MKRTVSSVATAICVQVAAEVAAAFPPRGIIKLLPAARTGGDRPALDRIIAEEYILDTISFFDGNRVDCAGRLAYGAFEEAQKGGCGVRHRITRRGE